MHVTTLAINNLRQFEERSFTFKPGFNLLVGENGAGKTTLLYALLTVLGGTTDGAKHKHLDDGDIRLHASSPVITISANLVDEYGRATTLTLQKRLFERTHRKKTQNPPIVLLYGSNEATCGSFVSRRSTGYSRPFNPQLISDELWLFERERGTRVPENTAEGGRFGNSQVVRRFVERVLSEFTNKFRDFRWGFEAYDCSILWNGEEQPDRELMKQLEHALRPAIMQYLRNLKVNPFLNFEQNVVTINSQGIVIGSGDKTTVMDTFADLLENTKIERRAISFAESCVAEMHLTPRIIIRSDLGSMMLSQLSDGEKRLFSLFVDIARRISINGSVFDSPSASAIILVDEIDVHFHPKWQRMIVPALEDLFPSCQFIATTHSPFVIQAVAPGKLTRLDGDQPSESEYVSQSIEDIVEQVQGVNMPQRSKRAEDVSKAAKEYFGMLRHRQSVSDNELRAAEIAYRKASEAFTSEPGLNALLQLETMSTPTP